MTDSIPTPTLYDTIRACAPSYYPRPWDWGLGGETFNDYERRTYFVKTFSWALPALHPIQKIAQFIGNRTCLEVGSGQGLWAALIRDTDVGARFIATDANPPENPFTEVARLKAVRAIRTYPEAQVLMLCWPPYHTRMASDALRTFTHNHLIYIGEQKSGCTGDDAFHRRLRDWREIDEISIPQWPGIHDALYFYERKP